MAFVNETTRTITVTTAGLGDALVGSGRAPNCDHPLRSSASALRVQTSPSGSVFTVFVPATSAVDDTNIDGKIVAFDATTRAELPIKVRSDGDGFYRLGSWVLFTLVAGVTVPALFTGLLGYAAYLAQQRVRDGMDARKAFDAAIAADENHIDDIFTRFVPMINKNERHCPNKWCGDLNDHLATKQQFDKMPEPLRGKLKTALKAGNRDAARTVLARLYPRWKHHILASETSDNDE